MNALRIGVLASHEGTTLQALLDVCASGDLTANVAVVISNNSASGALRRAKQSGIPGAHLSGRTHPDPGALDHAIFEMLQEHGTDLVVLAGYMKKVGSLILKHWDGRVINTHPALLPKFGGKGMWGLNVHQAVLDAREPASGASVFVVTEDYDAGPVIGQTKVDVKPGDTPQSLAERVQIAERALLVQVVRGFVGGDT